MKAPTKSEKEQSVLVAASWIKKGKKSKKNNMEGEGQIEFSVVKKFNNLKISLPMNDEDYEKTIKDLAELKDALIYWGKIIQRQSKIKYIRNSRKLNSDETFAEQATEEEKYIENEKAKYSSEDTTQHSLNPDKLKIAQVIDRESRINKAWNDEEEEDEDAVFGNEKEGTEPRERKPKAEGPKQAKRPNAQKFSEIMKADDAFPTLENNFGNEDEFDEKSEKSEEG